MTNLEGIVIYSNERPRSKKVKLTLVVDSVLIQIAKDKKINLSRTLESLLETLDGQDWKANPE